MYKCAFVTGNEVSQLKSECADMKWWMTRENVLLMNVQECSGVNTKEVVRSFLARTIKLQFADVIEINREHRIEQPHSDRIRPIVKFHSFTDHEKVRISSQMQVELHQGTISACNRR